MESKKQKTEILANHFQPHQKIENKPQIIKMNDMNMHQNLEKQLSELHHEDLDLDLQIHTVNLLFFLKKVEHENIVETMLQGVQYIIDKQIELQSRIVNKIQAEDWVISQIPLKLLQNSFTKFEVWSSENGDKRIESQEICEMHDDHQHHQCSYNDYQSRNVHIDYIITIGGDGTILRLLSQIREYEKYRNLPPIITFSSVSKLHFSLLLNQNYSYLAKSLTFFTKQGSLNYLGNFDIKEMNQVLDAAIFKINQASIELDPRMRLQLNIIKSNVDQLEIQSVLEKNNTSGSILHSQELQLMALNEITIMRNTENMLQVEVHINDVLLTVVQGDGVLIATPTGSTAYNLSCGGPIVHPSAQILCMTPIAPHSLSFRPVILPANEEVKIKIPDSARTSAKVTIDGHTKIDLNPEDCIFIKRSPYNVPFVKWRKQNSDQIWSRKLHKQLKWNQRIVQKPLKKLVIIKPKL